ncbi:pyruvate, orthophosphate dikinase, partial [Tanacetum coccineum]
MIEREETGEAATSYTWLQPFRFPEYDEFVGICGEHGGEPCSVAFFDGVGLDYVSSYLSLLF